MAQPLKKTSPTQTSWGGWFFLNFKDWSEPIITRDRHTQKTPLETSMGSKSTDTIKVIRLLNVLQYGIKRGF